MGINHDASDLIEQKELELQRFYNSLKEDTRISSYFFKPVEASEKIPDDVEYNQEWWGRYCADNNLDVKSGKGLRGSSSRDIIRYEDLQDYLSF